MTPTGLPEPLGVNWMRSLELEGNWGAVKLHHPSLTGTWSEGIQAEELAILPGMDEILAWYA